MVLLAASLSVYLLFPVIDESQAKFEALLSHETLTEREKFLRRQELLDFLQHPALPVLSDDGTLPATDGPSLYRDSRRRLSLLVQGEEQLALDRLPGGSYEAVSVNSDEIVRREYDARHRLSSVTVWQNARTASGVYLLRSVRYAYAEQAVAEDADFFYDEQTGSFVQAPRKSDLRERETLFFARDGSVVSREVISYDGYKNPVEKIREEGGTQVSRTARSFDMAGNLVLEEETVTVGGRQAVHRYEYTYTSFPEPDCAYYEDGVLRTTVSYESAVRFVRTVFFGDGITAVAVYEDGMKTEEHFEKE